MAARCEFSGDGKDDYQLEIMDQTIESDIVAVPATHESGMTNEDVKMLVIMGCDMRVFPRSFQEMFPNLNTLWVSGCTLESIGQEDIGKWKDLENMYVNDCRLKYLKGDTLHGLTELKNVTFEYNQLEEIGPDILDGLEELEQVSFRYNRNINMEVYGSEVSAIKQEIKLKCGPKPAVKTEVNERELSVEELKQQNQKLMAENAQWQMVKKNVLDDVGLTDLAFIVGGKSFHVHTFMFAAHSQSLIKHIHLNSIREKMKLSGITESTFRAIYDFIYTGQLPAEANFFEVFAAAYQLKMDVLMEAVAAHLIGTIDVYNSFELLALSDKFYHKELKLKAFENICINMFPGHEMDDELAKEIDELLEVIDAKKKLDGMFKEKASFF